VRRASPKVRILTIGHINTNKRVASVIHAIGSEARLRDSVHYQLVGQIEDSTAAELTDLARDTGVDLTISGVVSDEDLTVALEGADVICSLRWPTLESASASAIESMLWGKPTVVTGSGFCSEIPDECVAKVDPLSETSDLVRILLDLATDPKLRKQLGARASAWAKTTFSADRYAAGLEEMAKSVLRIAPAAHALTGLAEILENWQLSLSDDITERIVGPLRLFEHDFSKSRDVRR
jgi:glycosyltransferase involved in cell wall biosynthesis